MTEAAVTSELNSDALLAAAEQQSGLSDWGDLPFRDGLDSLVWALRHEAGLGPVEQGQAGDTIVALLVKRLRLVDDRARWPRIADERVEAPVVVLGLPRSGTTHLHALLAQRVGSRAPLLWEMNLPSPPPEAASFDTDARIDLVQQALQARPNHDELMRSHPFGASRPEQCLGLLDWSFVNQTFLAPWRAPSYYEWFLGADHRPAYEHHRRMLQHLQWRNPGSWVLKWPKHVFSLDALIATYPDARIVWTHRDPASVIPSVANFVGAIRRAGPGFDPRRFGAEWSAIEEMGLRRGMASRELLMDADRVVDVHYNDLMADPEATVAGVYEHFGMDFDDESRSRVRGFQEANPKDKHGAHRYSAEDYGLSAEGIRRRFAFYIEHYGVEPDRRSASPGRAVGPGRRRGSPAGQRQ